MVPGRIFVNLLFRLLEVNQATVFQKKVSVRISLTVGPAVAPAPFDRRRTISQL